MEAIKISTKEVKWRLDHEEDIEAQAEDMKRPCTICRKGLFLNDVFKHPVLGVVICKACLKFYSSGEFSEDEDGDQKYCTWCANGGTLNYCSKARCGAFCKTCITKNFDNKEVDRVAADNWNCYLCNSKPIWKLRASCDAIIERREAKMREKMPQNMLQLSQMSLEEDHSRSKSKTAEEKYSDESEVASRTSRSHRSNTNLPIKMNCANVHSSDKDEQNDGGPSSRKHPTKLKSRKSSLLNIKKPLGRAPDTSKLTQDPSVTLKVYQPSTSKDIGLDNELSEDDEISYLACKKLQKNPSSSKPRKNDVDQLTPNEDSESDYQEDNHLSKSSAGARPENDHSKDKKQASGGNRVERKMPSLRWMKSSLDDFRVFVSKNDKFLNRTKILHKNSSKEEVGEACDKILNYYKKCYKAFELYYKYFKQDYEDWQQKVEDAGSLEASTDFSETDPDENEDLEPEVDQDEEDKSVDIQEDGIETDSVQRKSTNPVKRKRSAGHSNPEEDIEEDIFADFDETLKKVSSPAKSLKVNTNPICGMIKKLDDEHSTEQGAADKDIKTDFESKSSEPLRKVDSELNCSLDATHKPTEKEEEGQLDDTIKTDVEAERNDPTESDLVENHQLYNGEEEHAGDSEDTFFTDDEETNALKEQEFLHGLLRDSDSDEQRKQTTEAKKEANTKRKNGASRVKQERFTPSNWKEFEDDIKLSLHPKIVLTPVQMPESSKQRTSRRRNTVNSDSEVANLCNLDSVENPSSSANKGTTRSKKAVRSKKSGAEDESSDTSFGEVAATSDLEPEALPSRSPRELDLQDQSDNEERAKNALLLDSDETDDDGDSDTKKRLQKTKNKKRKIIEDSDDENTEWMKAKELNTKLDLDSTDDEGARKRNKRSKQVVDSDNSNEAKAVKAENESSDSEGDTFLKRKKKPNKKKPSNNSDSDSDIFSDLKKSKKRKRIIQHESSDSECEVYYEGKSKLDSSGSPGKLRKRKILRKDELEKATQEAAKEEKERIKRQEELQKLYNKIIEERSIDAGVDELVLEFDPETKKPVVEVHKEIATKLKPHQVKGIRFMWNSVFESVERTKTTDGSGCILAHCMGLGKTLQVVAIVHTVMTHVQLNIKTCLIVTPLTTVENWKNEFAYWTKDINYGNDLNVYSLSSIKPSDRKNVLLAWKQNTGVMIISYDLYRNLANPQSKRANKREKDIFMKTLIDEGPDMVVCDEGHVLKNEEKKLSLVMSRIKTKRRIILTGTPLQNNLLEYHCMVQFIKPNFLGNRKEFTNRFVNPIRNGQHKESTTMQVKVMNKRACILHKMLEPSVQRYDYSVLKPHLQEKFEYVIKIKLSEVQIKLYSHFMENCARRMSNQKGACLFSDYQNLLRVWNHPYGLKLRALEDLEKEDADEDSAGSLKDFIDDDESSASSSSSESDKGSDGCARPSKRCTRQDVQNGQTLDDPTEVSELPFMNTWWKGLISDEELELLNSGSKMTLLFSILKECQEIGDKILVFSQSLYALNLIEHFLSILSSASTEERDENFCGLQGSWDCGINYFRIDGSTNIEHRNNFIKRFNNPRNTDAKLFLVSTRAGGLGVNMVGANRVILFDASWNPSNDMQSIFRVYRFGQTKPCYIYRFLAAGTMEEKIYDRQVTKLALSGRVVDKQAIDRHFTQADLEELYSFNPYEESNDKLAFPKDDRLLAEVINKHEAVIRSYFEHDSLLEDRPDEKLTPAEVQAAWEEFEKEKESEIQRRENFALEQQRLIELQRYNLEQSAKQHELNALLRGNISSVQDQVYQNAFISQLLSRGPQIRPNLMPNMGPRSTLNTGFQNYINSARQDHRAMNNLESQSAAWLNTLTSIAANQLQHGTTSGPSRAQPISTDDPDIEVLPQPMNNPVPRSSSSSAPPGPSTKPVLSIRKDIFK